jgi:hypothetical protein
MTLIQRLRSAYCLQYLLARGVRTTRRDLQTDLPRYQGMKRYQNINALLYHVSCFEFLVPKLVIAGLVRTQRKALHRVLSTFCDDISFLYFIRPTFVYNVYGYARICYFFDVPAFLCWAIGIALVSCPNGMHVQGYTCETVHLLILLFLRFWC